MKIQKQQNSLVINNNGWGQMIISLLMIIGGIALAVATITGFFQDTPWWLSLVGLGLVGLGGLFAYTANTRVVTLSRDGQSSISSKRLLGGKTQSQEFSLSSVVAVYLQTTRHTRSTTVNNRSNRNSNRPEIVSHLSLVTNTNDVIELGQKRNSNSMSVNGLNVSSLVQKAPLSKEAKTISEFIGVPLQSNSLGSALDVTKQIAGAFTGQNTPQQTTPGQVANQAQAPQGNTGQPLQQPVVQQQATVGNQNTPQSVQPQTTPQPQQQAAPQPNTTQAPQVEPTHQPTPGENINPQ